MVLDVAGGRVEAIHARSLDGTQVQVRARSFVLAAGGLENARLLLVSRRRQTLGIGNNHDLVGRFYMDHPRVVYGRVHLNRPVQLPTLLGSPLADGKIQVGIGLSEEKQRREALVNSYLSLEPQLSNVAEERYRTSIGVAKVLLRKGHAGGRMDWSAMRMDDLKDMIYLLTPKEILPHAVYRSYVALRRRLFGSAVSGKLTVINYCEQLPNRESRTYLSEERDRLRMNTLVLDWRVGLEERRSMVRLHERLAEQLRRTGIGRLSRTAEVAELTFTDASHHIGTTRMSNDPRHGVVDANCRVHGVANLFIAGSSVFPNSGNANPTWTIVALALRLAGHLRLTSRGVA
jgi:choline dehydrogenase-like flavoprotein